MPIYAYQCKSCGHDLEVIQKISDEPLKECPECHQPELVKQVTAAAFRLKGGGWYETDFKSGSDKKKNLASDAATASASSAPSATASTPSSSST